MTEIRVVMMDTGVLLSEALFPESVPRRLFDKVSSAGQFLVSGETLKELTLVFLREKFDRYLSRRVRLEFIWAFAAKARLVEIRTRTIACRDPKDIQFLDVAVNGSATQLVTGDADLLVLNPFQGIPVLTPAEFLSLLNK